MNIDISKITKLQLFTTLAMLIAGLWLIIEIFRGDISFSANWNMFKSPIGNICVGIGFIMAIIWWGKFGHWSQTTVRETKDQWGNVVKRETNYDITTTLFDSFALPLIGHLIIEPIVYGALIYYPIQVIIAIVGSIFPYLVILLVLGLIAGTWMIADRLTGKRRIAFIVGVALLSAGMAGWAGYLHYIKATPASTEVTTPTYEGTEILESVDPSPDAAANHGVMHGIKMRGDGIYCESHNIKLGDTITQLPGQVKELYDTYAVHRDTGMDDEEMTVVNFSLHGREIFTAYSYDHETIAWISTSNADVQVELYDRYYHVGDAISDKAKKQMAWDDAYGGMYFYKDFAIPYDIEKEQIVSISIGEAPF